MELGSGTLVIRMDGWMDVGVDGIVLAHRDIEFEAVKLDNRSSPFVVLIGIMGGAAKVRVQNWNRAASRNPPKSCIAVESAVACLRSTAQDRQSQRIGKKHS